MQRGQRYQYTASNISVASYTEVEIFRKNASDAREDLRTGASFFGSNEEERIEPGKLNSKLNAIDAIKKELADYLYNLKWL